MLPGFAMHETSDMSISQKEQKVSGRKQMVRCQLSMHGYAGRTTLGKEGIIWDYCEVNFVN